MRTQHDALPPGSEARTEMDGVIERFEADFQREVERNREYWRQVTEPIIREQEEKDPLRKLERAEGQELTGAAEKHGAPRQEGGG